MDGWLKEALWLVRLSVAPAKGEYSPPEREVGMLMMGMEHGLRLAVCASAVRAERSSRVEALFARACVRSR